MAYTKRQVEEIAITFIIVPAIFVFLRIWAKIQTRSGGAGLKLDDWTILIALVSWGGP